MKIFNKGFNFSQDGPGNRLVYHLQGCNMRCIWCSNPEGMSISGGKDYNIEEIFREVKRSEAMFFSGGGVTFTGGEATVQEDELLKLLKMLKTAGIHTAIETNGTSPRLLEIAEFVDYLIMDFKHYDGEVLKKYTGMGNETIKSNFEKFSQKGRQLHIRIPLINGINTDNPGGFAEYFAKWDTKNIVFEFLPYHEYGKEKWTEEYMIKDGFVLEDKLQEFRQIFENYNLKIVNT